MPEEARDAARGMGMTDNQMLRRVELPLAMPEILAGLRIAFTTTVGLATLAFFAGGGGLGEHIYSSGARHRRNPLQVERRRRGRAGRAAGGDRRPDHPHHPALRAAVAAGGGTVSLSPVLAQTGGADDVPAARQGPRATAPSATRSTSSSTSASRSPAASASAGPASSGSSRRRHLAVSLVAIVAATADHRAARPLAGPHRQGRVPGRSPCRTSGAPCRRLRCWPSSSRSSASASSTSRQC